MRTAPVPRLALACLLLTLLAPVRAAIAGGVGVSEVRDSVVTDSSLATAAVNTVPFHLYKAPVERGVHAYRDIDFLWSDTYKSRFRTPLDTLTGPQQINDMDRLGQAACEIQSNPLGLPWTDIQVNYNFLASRTGYRDSLYNAFPQAPIGFRVAQSAYPDVERNHLDTYLYAPSFGGYSQWATYHGDGSDGSFDTPNYGMFPSGYVSSAEDSLTGRAGSPLTLNAIQVPGPLPSQVGGTVGSYWSRPGGSANGALMHEGLHCLNSDGGGFLHMFASGAEMVTGVSSDPPRYDVDYHFSLSPTGANEGNAYPHWQSFTAYLAFNWRGADTTTAGWADDLLRRWATKDASERNLPGLAKRLRDSECAECAQYPGFAGLDSLARVQRLIHDWRVADYVNNSSLSGGKYGFPPQFGFSPANATGAWQNVDGVTWDDGYAVPPVVTLGPADIDRTRSFTARPAGPGFVARPLKLGMFGAEYFVLRADPGLAPQKLVVNVNPALLLNRKLQVQDGVNCQPAPPYDVTARLYVSVVTYSQAADSLFRHPEWATGVFTQSTLLDSVGRALEFEIPDFDSTTKAALVVVTLEDGPQGYFSSGDSYAEVRDSLAFTLGVTLVAPAASAGPRAIAASVQTETAPAWSPDGTKLAYGLVDGSGVGRIYQRPADGSGAPTPLRTASLGQYEPVWSPRGGTVVYCDGNDVTRRLWKVDVASGASQQISTKSHLASSPAYSPNGSQVAYLRAWLETISVPPPQCSTCVGPPVTTHYRDVRSVDLATGIDSLLWRFIGPSSMSGLRWSPNGRYLTFSRLDTTTDERHLHQLDVRTLSLTSHDSQSPEALMRELRPGFGALLVEEDSGLPYQTTCSSQAYAFCNCQPGSAIAPAHWIALRDTLAGTSTPLAYRTGATFSAPRWSSDGTRVAYTTTQNGNPDVYVAAATDDRAPVFSSMLQSSYSITACSPFDLPLPAADPDNDPITREVFDLPAGAVLQSNGTIYWEYPVIGSHWIIARALDPQGAVATRVINFNVTDGGGCGGGGGEEDPPILPGGGNSARQADSNRLFGGAGSGPLRAANTFLDGAASGEWVAQTARLVAAQSDSTGHVTTRLAALRPGVLKVDRAQLVVVDHAPHTVAVATGDGIAVGPKHRAARLAIAGGEELANALVGVSGEARLLAAGTVLTVEWTATDSVAGLVVDCARASAPETDSEWGVRIEVPEGGNWRTVGRIHPRAGYDALAAPLVGNAPVRLVFASETYVREVAGYSLTAADDAPATLTTVTLSGTDVGSGVENLATADSVAVELTQGQRLTMLFDGPPMVADQRRTLFLDLVASFTPEGGAGQMGSRATEALPVRFALQRNQPNPFGGGTTIRFDAPRAAAIKIEVFDAQGRRVRTLADRTFEPGTHAIVWEGTDASGRRARPGVYLYRMTADGFRDQRRMVLLGR